jgi:hypothetical protein
MKRGHLRERNPLIQHYSGRKFEYPNKSSWNVIHMGSKLWYEHMRFISLNNVGLFRVTQRYCLKKSTNDIIDVLVK